MWTGGTDALLNWCVHRLLNSHIAHFISRLEWLNTFICLSFLQKEGWVTPYWLSFGCEMCLFFLAVKVVERPLNTTSFLIPASFTGTGWCSNFSIVILSSFCWYKSTKYIPVVKAIKIFVAYHENNLCNCLIFIIGFSQEEVLCSVCQAVSQAVAQAACQCVKFAIKKWFVADCICQDSCYSAIVSALISYHAWIQTMNLFVIERVQHLCYECFS